LPVLLALESKERADEALRLWRGSAGNPDGVRQLALFLDRHGFLAESQSRARGLLKELFALSRSLPHAPGARELEAFFEAMASRQF